MVEIIGAPCSKGVQELHPIIAGAEVYLSVRYKRTKTLLVPSRWLGSTKSKPRWRLLGVS